MKENRWIRQQAVPFLGEFKQLLGSASMWITMAIFGFSLISAWDTSTVMIVRRMFPWLSLPVFVSLMAVGLGVIMWVEHKFVQPSVMTYWNRMFYNHGNPLRKDIEIRMKALDDKLARIEKLLGEGHEVHGA